MTPDQRARLEKLIRQRYSTHEIEDAFREAMACDRGNFFDWLTDKGLNELRAALINLDPERDRSVVKGGPQPKEPQPKTYRPNYARFPTIDGTESAQ